jgi:hypothetical protein
MITWDTITDTDWEQMTDEEIANQLGCHSTTVNRYRRKHNLPATPSKNWNPVQINFDLVLDDFGKLTDRQIAEKLGCGVSSVHQYRKKHDIPIVRATASTRKKRVLYDWDSVIDDFGKLNDRQIAEKLGCHPSAVRRKRKYYEFPAAPSSTLNNAVSLYKWDTVTQHFGRLRDPQIAALLGCTPATVCVYRRKHHIPTVSDANKLDLLLPILPDERIHQQTKIDKIQIATYRVIREIPEPNDINWTAVKAVCQRFPHSFISRVTGIAESELRDKADPSQKPSTKEGEAKTTRRQKHGTVFERER